MPDYENRQPFYLVRIGEIMFAAERNADAFVVLQKVNSEYPRTEFACRSYYNLGNCSPW